MKKNEEPGLKVQISLSQYSVGVQQVFYGSRLRGAKKCSVCMLQRHLHISG